MKKNILDLYSEIEKRTDDHAEKWPRGIFYHTIDGSIDAIGRHSWETAPDLSNFSNNVFFGIKEEPPGMENLNYIITIYDYENKQEVEAYRMYFKPGTGRGRYDDRAREALKIIRQVLDDIQEEIYSGSLKLIERR